MHFIMVILSLKRGKGKYCIYFKTICQHNQNFFYIVVVFKFVGKCLKRAFLTRFRPAGPVEVGTEVGGGKEGTAPGGLSMKHQQKLGWKQAPTVTHQIYLILGDSR